MVTRSLVARFGSKARHRIAFPAAIRKLRTEGLTVTVEQQKSRSYLIKLQGSDEQVARGVSKIRFALSR